MSDFLTLVQGAIEENDQIARFIKAICYGNMRFALEMFCTFITSGVTDVGKMLKIYNRDGWYNVAFHEFVKAIMLGEASLLQGRRKPYLQPLQCRTGAQFKSFYSVPYSFSVEAASRRKYSRRAWIR